MNGQEPSYLGDSVYARTDEARIVLYTDNGYGPRNIIYLDHTVFQALVAYGLRYFTPPTTAPKPE